MMRYPIIAAAIIAAVAAAALLLPHEASNQPSHSTTATSPSQGAGVNHYPRIMLIYPKGGEVLSGTVRVRWNITDPDGDEVVVTVAVTDDPFPTCATCPPQEWHYLMINGSNTGSLEWDTRSLQDGEYMLMIEAWDGKDLSRAYSDWFIISNG